MTLLEKMVWAAAYVHAGYEGSPYAPMDVAFDAVTQLRQDEEGILRKPLAALTPQDKLMLDAASPGPFPPEIDEEEG